MRQIPNFKARGLRLVEVNDSLTGQHSTASYRSEALLRLWVRPQYQNGTPSLYDPFEAWRLEDKETPPPAKGWAYAKGYWA